VLAKAHTAISAKDKAIISPLPTAPLTTGLTDCSRWVIGFVPPLAMFNSEDHLSGKVGSHGSQQWQHLMTVDTAQAHSHGHRARKAASRTRPSQAPFQLGAASSSFKRRSQHQHHQHQHQHQQSSTKTLSGSRHSADPRSVSPIRYRPVRRGHGGNPGPRARPTPMVMAAEASRHQAKLEQPSSATVVKKHTMRSPPPPNIGREGAPHHRHAAHVPRGHSKSADRIAAQVLLRKQRLQRPSEPPVLYTQPHRINAAGGVTVLNPAAPAFRGSVHGGGPVSVAAASQGSGESKEGARHKPSGSGGAMASVLGDLDRFVARNYGVQARAEAAQSVEAHNPFPASYVSFPPRSLHWCAVKAGVCLVFPTSLFWTVLSGLFCTPRTLYAALPVCLCVAHAWAVVVVWWPTLAV